MEFDARANECSVWLMRHFGLPFVVLHFPPLRCNGIGLVLSIRFSGLLVERSSKAGLLHLPEISAMLGTDFASLQIHFDYLSLEIWREREMAIEGWGLECPRLIMSNSSKSAT